MNDAQFLIEVAKGILGITDEATMREAAKAYLAEKGMLAIEFQIVGHVTDETAAQPAPEPDLNPPEAHDGLEEGAAPAAAEHVEGIEEAAVAAAPEPEPFPGPGKEVDSTGPAVVDVQPEPAPEPEPVVAEAQPAPVADGAEEAVEKTTEGDTQA